MSRWLEQRLRRVGQKTTELHDFAVYSLERLERGKTCFAVLNRRCGSQPHTFDFVANVFDGC
jgi:hypothetical protein